MVGEDRFDLLPIGLHLQRLGFEELKEIRESHAETLSCQAKLFVDHSLVLGFDQCRLVSRAHGSQGRGDIRTEREFLFPEVEVQIVNLNPCLLDLPLATQALKDRKGDPNPG